MLLAGLLLWGLWAGRTRRAMLALGRGWAMGGLLTPRERLVVRRAALSGGAVTLVGLLLFALGLGEMSIWITAAGFAMEMGIQVFILRTIWKR